mmetsp:Transcript_34601/g.106889  ORF Transcript_34601/g.106889 Transcript_34601/m.106889 type:complete len:325 (+) Transcript_34601:398-1372(+)
MGTQPKKRGLQRPRLVAEAGRRRGEVHLVAGLALALGGGGRLRAEQLRLAVRLVVLARGAGALDGGGRLAVHPLEFKLAAAAGGQHLLGGRHVDGRRRDVAGAEEERVDDVRVVDREAHPLLVRDVAVAVAVRLVEQLADGRVREVDVVADEGRAEVAVEDVALVGGVEVVEDGAQLLAHRRRDARVGGDAAAARRADGVRPRDAVARVRDGALDVHGPHGLRLERVHLAAARQLRRRVEVDPAHQDVVVDLERLHAERHVRVAGRARRAGGDVELRLDGVDELRDGRARGELHAHVVLAGVDVRGHVDEEDHGRRGEAGWRFQ